MNSFTSRLFIRMCACIVIFFFFQTTTVADPIIITANAIGAWKPMNLTGVAVTDYHILIENLDGIGPNPVI